VKISILTLFPGIFDALAYSMMARANSAGAVTFELINPREFARDKHRTVDDAPYGGGAGMVMRPDVLRDAVGYARVSNPGAPVVYLSPQGAPFKQAHAESLAALPGLILVCGRYEGVDERFIEACVDYEISVGDFILTGGEPAALCVADAVVRLLPGVLGNSASAVEESFGDGALEHPQFTRPRDFDGRPVPPVLLSGDHGRVANWRRRISLERTAARRPDMMIDELSPNDLILLENPDFDTESWLVDPRHVQVAVDD
jgi:tRNA (guanine37-N1)-methyltransferase